jgi:eukaryotic-like serine/threonine-protein kinase
MSATSWVGKTLGGRYTIDRPLGKGGMSAVYRASDPNLKRAVAVKLIHAHLADSPEFVRRFREEATTVAQLRHPHIVQVFDFNREGETFYMVMELITGETLREYLDRLKASGRVTPLADMVKYAADLCDAEDYAHKRGLIHRDIKPANVIINAEGQAILMDFGIAKILGGEQFTATGATLGTALYMAPEQVRGEQVDKRTDIYATGATVYEMIAGEPPYSSTSVVSLLMMHVNDPVPDLRSVRTDVPPALVAIVQKAMAKKSEDRFQTAAEMAASLRAVGNSLQDSGQGRTVAEVTDVQRTVPDLDTGPRERARMAPTVADSGARATAPSLGGGAIQTRTSRAATAGGPLAGETVRRPAGGSSSRRGWLFAGLAGLAFLAVLVVVAGGLAAWLLFGRDGGGPADEGSLTPTTAAAGIAPTETSSTAAAVTPTGEPAVPTLAPSPTPSPSPSPTPQALLGLLRFRDSEQERAGAFQLTMAEVGPSVSGTQYALWLDRDGQPLFLGSFQSAGGVSFAGDAQENLLGAYAAAFITVESDDHTGGSPGGQIVFRGAAPDGPLAHIRALVAGAPETPGRQAYLVGAEEETRLALEHAGFMNDALAAGSLSMARQHAEHIVNILDGRDGDFFGDLDRNGLAENPGDGFGVRSYLLGAVEAIQAASESEDANTQVTLHAPHTLTATENALLWLDEVISLASRLLAADSVSEARTSGEAVFATLEVMLNGLDANNDGVVDLAPGESGLMLAYEHALNMGSFEFFAASN